MSARVLIGCELSGVVRRAFSAREDQVAHLPRNRRRLRRPMGKPSAWI